MKVPWTIGILLLVTYTVISYWRLHREIDTAVRFKDNIFQSENVSSPFVLGLIKPRIYLPFNMNGQDLEHVVAHEQAHIRRKDHWWKPLGFLLLTIHWFNPFMWLSYVLLCRDIELACDEKVIRELGKQTMSEEVYVEQWIDGTCVRSAPVVMTQHVDSIDITMRERRENGVSVGTDIQIETNLYGGSLLTYFAHPEN